MSNNQQQLFGFEKRAENRKRSQSSIRAYVQLLVDRNIVTQLNISHPDSAPANIKNLYAEIIADLYLKYPKFNQYRFARNYFATLINNGNKDKKWSLPVPAYIHRYRRETVLRNDKWFNKSRKLNLWTQKWLEKLSVYSCGFSDDENLGNCLMSACIFGGLCIPEAIKSLRDVLVSEQKPLIKDNFGLHFDLLFVNNSESYNVIVNDTGMTLRRWYPDYFTLGLINTFLKNVNGAPVKSGRSIWHLLRGTFSSVDDSILELVKSTQQLCLASTGVLENLPSSKINQASIGYLTGKVSSASLPTEVHQMLMQQHNQNISLENQIIFKHNQARERHKIKNEQFLNIENAISDVRHAIKTKDSKGVKRNRTDAIEKLKGVIDLHISFNLTALVRWLIELLEKEELKLSSANRYWSAISIPWLANTSAVDISAFESEDFEHLYNQILEGSGSNKNRRYVAGRLDHFHSFIQSRYQMPPLNESLSKTEGRSHDFVTAYYIPQSAFSKVLLYIEESIPDKSLKITLKASVIIAIRTGIRIGELLKIRINDIENSAESWLFIRGNKFGDGKSNSSTRKLPLNALLISDERQFIQNYIRTRRNIAKSSNILLFSEANTPHLPIDSKFISSLFSRIATGITGVKSTFHGLRHTALSNLHLVLEEEFDKLNWLVGYSSHDVSEIRNVLGYNDNNNFERDKYWLLASFAGHSSPAITFNNYLHFTDYIVAKKLRTAYTSIPKTCIEATIGLSKNALTRITKRSKTTEDWYRSVSARLDLEISKIAINRYSSAAQTNNISMTGNNSSLFKPTEPSIDICYSVLKCLEEGDPMDEIIIQHNLGNSSLIEKWAENATVLEHERRLRARSISKSNNERTLAPRKPQTLAELKEANEAIVKLRDLFVNKKQDLVWAIDYFIHNSNRSDPLIRFAERDNLERFLAIMLDVFVAKRWEIYIVVPKSGISFELQNWKSKCEENDISVSTVEKKYDRKIRISYGLRLRHPEEAKIIEKRQVDSYSARTLGYLFHMLKIML